MVEMC